MSTSVYSALNAQFGRDLLGLVRASNPQLGEQDVRVAALQMYGAKIYGLLPRPGEAWGPEGSGAFDSSLSRQGAASQGPQGLQLSQN